MPRTAVGQLLGIFSAPAIEAEVLRVQHGRVRDDVAVLVARVPASERFPARPAGVAALA